LPRLAPSLILTLVVGAVGSHAPALAQAASTGPLPNVVVLAAVPQAKKLATLRVSRFPTSAPRT
jgi:hypothetical protein